MFLTVRNCWMLSTPCPDTFQTCPNMIVIIFQALSCLISSRAATIWKVNWGLLLTTSVTRVHGSWIMCFLSFYPLAFWQTPNAQSGAFPHLRISDPMFFVRIGVVRLILNVSEYQFFSIFNFLGLAQFHGNSYLLKVSLFKSNFHLLVFTSCTI